jgi:hypothetical protein
VGDVTNLSGPTLSVAAFTVTAATPMESQEWLAMTITVLDARETCSSTIGVLSEAPPERRRRT